MAAAGMDADIAAATAIAVGTGAAMDTAGAMDIAAAADITEEPMLTADMPVVAGTAADSTAAQGVASTVVADTTAVVDMAAVASTAVVDMAAVASTAAVDMAAAADTEVADRFLLKNQSSSQAVAGICRQPLSFCAGPAPRPWCCSGRVGSAADRSGSAARNRIIARWNDLRWLAW